jgi:hypothetical protein
MIEEREGDCLGYLSFCLLLRGRRQSGTSALRNVVPCTTCRDRMRMTTVRRGAVSRLQQLLMAGLCGFRPNSVALHIRYNIEIHVTAETKLNRPNAKR